MGFDGHYGAWRKSRLDFILKEIPPEEIVNRTLFEVGCGYGDIGQTFHKIGAIVTCSDARKEHLDNLSNLYPCLKTYQMDLDAEWSLDERFDIVVDMGVLYHLSNYKKHIKDVCSHCKDILILETEVNNSLDPDDEMLIKDAVGYDQAYNKYGTRPSASGVERELDKNGFRFIRCDEKDLNADMHVYDWIPTGRLEYVEAQRRFWFARRKLGFGIIHAPYIPEIVSPVPFDIENFNPQKGNMTRKGKSIHEHS